MGNDRADELGQLRLSIDRLTQGLLLVVETQQTQSEMLRALLDAAAAPEPGSSPLTVALAEVATALRDQMGSLIGVQDALAELPARVGAAVTTSLQAALSEL